MAKCIISALRCLPQLKGSTFLAAIEIAHRASDQNGITFMSYTLIAAKCHQSRRTAIRHVAKLIELGILKCQRFWQPGGKFGINKYVFAIRWEHPHSYPPARNGDSDILCPIFPGQRNTEEKHGTIADIENAKRRALGWLTEGSALWHMTQAMEVSS